MARRAAAAVAPRMSRKRRNRAQDVRARAAKPGDKSAAIEASSGVARPQGAATRIPAIDALRGLAIVAMIAYHFAFDMRYFHVIQADFESDPFWLGARAAIVTSFLLLVGVSLVLSEKAGASRAAFWRRVGVIASCALAASIGSAILYPQTFIYFGILHCIAVSTVLAQPFLRRAGIALACGVAVIAAGLVLGHPVFDTRALSWIGFTTVKPPTQDFVPLFPWFGVVLVGIALGAAFAARRFAPIAVLNAAPRALRWLGRHSLAIYMVHQPLMIGVLWIVVGS
jgi:uncharacterized membrane protein